MGVAASAGTAPRRPGIQERARTTVRYWATSAAAAARDLAATKLLGLGVGDVQLTHSLAGSWNVIRTVAPFPSAISAPDISETSTVLRATCIPPWRSGMSGVPYRKRRRNHAALRARRIRQDRSRLRSAFSSGSRPMSRAFTTRNWRGRNLRSFARRDTARRRPGSRRSCAHRRRISEPLSDRAHDIRDRLLRFGFVSGTPCSASAIAAVNVPPQVRKSLAVNSSPMCSRM